MSLDELIDLVLTDKYLTYNSKEVKQLEMVLGEKVEKIPDPSKREFYEGIVEGLIFEMNEALAKSKGTVYINPIKENYDEIEKELNRDLEKANSVSNEVERLCKFAFDKSTYENQNSLIRDYVLSVKKRIIELSTNRTKFSFEENRSYRIF
ncbi:hypothetical protein [Spirosoma migulaei]